MGEVQGLKELMNGIEEVKSEINRLAVSAVREAKNYAEKELPKRYSRILSLYYADYEPNIYARTGQLYGASYTLYTHSSSKGLRACVGIKLTPEDMSYKSGYSSEQVIEDYMDGWHGGRQSGIPAGFSPYGLFENSVQSLVSEICSNEDIIASAKAKANLRILR